MPLRLLCALLLLAAPAFAAEEILSDKSALTKIMGLYRKVLAGAQQAPPAPGSVICVGSSHMQLWKGVNEDLAPLTVRNFGIGGSRMTHAADLFVDGKFLVEVMSTPGQVESWDRLRLRAKLKAGDTRLYESKHHHRNFIDADLAREHLTAKNSSVRHPLRRANKNVLFGSCPTGVFDI
jgi:hypothetical protein